MFHQIFESILAFFGGLSYTSVFFLMTLESSIFPVPSEAVMIPAGYLAATGKLDLWLLLAAGTLGSMFGAILNYYILGQWIGKTFLEKYGKYLLINHKKYLEAESLFLKNDRLYTFLGRFIPVIRHLISIPAGMFRMNFPVFLFLTGLGAGIWCLILLLVGYFFGEEVVEIASVYTKEVSIIVVIGLLLWGIWFLRKKK
ncbi:MAG: DedA family protein [Candidatus Gracilibacteria bacterium]|nr:DedA family protein [Candidatus Gracilibacteria bacterium]